jgi:hypothetical protein
MSVMRLTLAAAVFVVALMVHAQAPEQHDDHHAAGVARRGDEAMGFSHERSTHHFRLYKDGGAIEVSANQATDTDSRDMIRVHLAHIAKMFAAGNFNTPMFIHDTNPPGAAKMAELRGKIAYCYEDIPSGGRVRIASKDPRAVSAIHQFLRFQIDEHRTGDPKEVPTEAVDKRN